MQMGLHGGGFGSVSREKDHRWAAFTQLNAFNFFAFGLELPSIFVSGIESKHQYSHNYLEGLL
jgi:hypothetical protein